MFRWRLIGLLLGAPLWHSSAAAQEQAPPTIEITYERALSVARDKAPRGAVARARVREAESEVEAASVWPFNPQLSGRAGPRFGSGDMSLDWSVGAQQWLELGGQSEERADVAQAGVLRARARSEDAERLLLRDVSAAFVSTLHSQRRVDLAEENLLIAEAIERVAKRRHEVGDVGALEESVAELSVVRARSLRDRAQAALARCSSRMKALIGLDAESVLRLRGDLRDLGLPTGTATDVLQRPDLRALRAEIRHAEAEAELGRSNRVPNLAVGAGFAREESDSILRGTLTIALPLFDHGQGTTALSEARRDRVRAELVAAGVAARAEVESAEAALLVLSEAARRFRDGLSTLERTERLANASYAAGAIALGELLALRRELMQAKLDYAELLLEAAMARTALDAGAGAFQ